MKCCNAAPRIPLTKDENKQPHQNPRQQATEMKTTVQQNQGKREESEPQMATHPGLSSADSPDGKLLAQAKQSREQHEREANDCRRSDRERFLREDLGAIEGCRGCTPRLQWPELPCCRETICDECDRSARELSLRHAGLLEQSGKELRWIHAMRGIVRTGVHAAGLGMVVAQVAGRSLHPGAGDFPARVRGIVEFDWEWMQVDVAVGTIVGAQAAADAPVFDDDFERVAAADGADGASDHAQRIAALAAGSGHQIFVEAQTLRGPGG